MRHAGHGGHAHVLHRWGELQAVLVTHEVFAVMGQIVLGIRVIFCLHLHLCKQAARLVVLGGGGALG